METISTKQEEESRTSVFVISILNFHPNPKVLIQGFV